jgi:hypothetical protein
VEWPIVKDYVQVKNLLIKDARGNDLGYKGTSLVSIQILGRKLMHDLVVVENVQDTIIIIHFVRHGLTG